MTLGRGAECVKFSVTKDLLCVHANARVNELVRGPGSNPVLSDFEACDATGPVTRPSRLGGVEGEERGADEQKRGECDLFKGGHKAFSQPLDPT